MYKLSSLVQKLRKKHCLERKNDIAQNLAFTLQNHDLENNDSMSSQL